MILYSEFRNTDLQNKEQPQNQIETPESEPWIFVEEEATKLWSIRPFVQ